MSSATIPAEAPRPSEDALAHDPRLPRRDRRGWLVLGAGVVLIGVLALGIGPRLQRPAQLAETAQAADTHVPAVQVVTPHRASASADVVLPGNIQAVEDTPIYARATGYLRRWLVDIGDRVSAGQVLAEI